MPKWRFSRGQTNRQTIGADSWTDALQIALPTIVSQLAGTRLGARLTHHGVVELTLDGSDETIFLRPQHARWRPASNDGNSVVLLEDCTYVSTHTNYIQVPFCMDEYLDESEADGRSFCERASNQPPPGFETEVDAACARFQSTQGTNLQENAWCALAIWLTFVECDAVGLRCSTASSESWFARQGSTNGLAGGPREAAIRKLARDTGTSWSVFDGTRNRAGMISPLPEVQVCHGEDAQGTLEVWRSGPAYADWQLEVGQLAATMLSDRMAPETLALAAR
jgi:hypothetical protein